MSKQNGAFFLIIQIIRLCQKQFLSLQQRITAKTFLIIMYKPTLAVLFIFSLLAQSCGSNSQKPKQYGTIVLGDSATIITETDEQYLASTIKDFEPIVTPAKTEIPTAATPPKDSIATPKTETRKPSNTALEAPFKGLEISIEGVEGRLGGKTDWNKSSAASFTLSNGELNNKTLKIKTTKIEKVQMRYQTVLLLKLSNGKTIVLEDMPTFTSEWQTQKGNNGAYPISGFGANQLKYGTDFSAKKVSAAAQSWARKNKMNRNDEKVLLQSIRNVRAANQTPLSIGLSTVIWKIDGTDAARKTLHRELRIDINP